MANGYFNHTTPTNIFDEGLDIHDSDLEQATLTALGEPTDVFDIAEIVSLDELNANEHSYIDSYDLF